VVVDGGREVLRGRGVVVVLGRIHLYGFWGVFGFGRWGGGNFKIGKEEERS
jgi:hypothetical protein